MFVQIPENKSFRTAPGITLKPIVTLKNENNDYAFIVRDDDNNYVLYRKDSRQFYMPSHLWFPEAVFAMHLLPTPDRLPLDEKGNPIPPGLGELPEHWDISRDTPGIFICVQYRETSEEVGSRELTGNRLKVKTISGVKNAYTVSDSTGFPQIVGQRVTHDPVKDKIYVG